MILVDSSVWIDYFRGTLTPQTDRLDALLGQDLLAIGDLILTEVLQGVDEDREFESIGKMMASLTVIELGGKEVAMRAAGNFRALRKLGVTPRKTIDVIIATRCIVSGLELLHSDRDFDPFVKHLGLRLASV